MKDIQKVLMKNYSSLRIGGEADMVIVDSEEKLREAFSYAKARNIKVSVLGEGTNSFFKDVIQNLLFLKMEIKGIDIKENDNNVLLTVGAGEIWDNIVEYAVNKDWWGVENLSYIPGTVGASPVQNIGAYGSELKDALISLRVYDTTTDDFMELLNEQCNFGYRSSIFKEEKGRYIIVSITIKLSKIPNPILTYKPLDNLLDKENIALKEIRGLVIKTRKEKLPDYNVYPNTGSFFKNPIIDKLKVESLKVLYPNIPLHETENGYKIPAAWLIEHIAKMKGVRVGDVGTWPNQPLVIVNYGNAKYEDLILFSGMIVHKIEQVIGVVLEREVNFVE